MKNQDKKEATVRALDKALTILGILSKIDEEIDLATLAKQTQIPKSTLLRLINTLKKHKFIQQNIDIKFCPRCTYSNVNEIFENVIIEDKMMYNLY